MDGDKSTTLFVGGLPPDCQAQELMDYFSMFGSIANADVKIDPTTGRSRGFGFITFTDPQSTDAVVANAASHTIRDKWVDVKVYNKASANAGKDKGGPKGGGKGGKKGAPMYQPAPYQSYQPPAPTYQPPSYGAPAGGKDAAKAQTLFVGGLPATITQEDFQAYFGMYGALATAEVKMDPATGKPRGFGFVEYVDPESVRECLANAAAHTIHDKWIDVKVYNNKGGGGKGGPKGGKGPPAPAYSPYGGASPYAAYGARPPAPAYGAAPSVYQGYGRAPMRPY